LSRSELLALRSEKDGTIATRDVDQQYRFGTPKPCGIGGELEVQIGRDPPQAGPQLLGKPVQVSGPAVYREKMKLPLVQGGIDVHELSIDVDGDVGLVELEVGSEELSTEHDVSNGRIDSKLQPFSALDDPFLLSPSPLVRVHGCSRRPAGRRGL
jgi:hypothetical protein